MSSILGGGIGKAVAIGSAKVAPMATVSATTIGGVELNQWILWGTLLYTGLLIGHKSYQIYNEVRLRKARAEREA